MAREILPNVTQPIIVEGTVRLGYAVFTAATLSFLGFGLQPPSSDWGLTIALERVLLQIAAGRRSSRVALASLVVAVNLITTARQGLLAMSADLQTPQAGDAAPPPSTSATSRSASTAAAAISGGPRRHPEHREGRGLRPRGRVGVRQDDLAMAAMRYLAATAPSATGACSFDGQDVSTLSDEAMRRWRAARSDGLPGPANGAEPGDAHRHRARRVFRYHEAWAEGGARARSGEPATGGDPRPDSTLNRYPFELWEASSSAWSSPWRWSSTGSADPRPADDWPRRDRRGRDPRSHRGAARAHHAAILLITHNLGLVARLCERVGVLTLGGWSRTARRATSSRPAHPSAWGLLGCVPRFGMNKMTLPCRRSRGPCPRWASPSGRVSSARCPWPGRVQARRATTCSPGRATAAAGRRARPRSRRRTGRRTRRITAHPVGEPARQSAATSRPRSSRCPSVAPAGHRPRGPRGDGGHVLAIDTVPPSRTASSSRRSTTSRCIAAGETFGLVGDVRQRQTTLAKCVTGLIPADAGTITFEEMELRDRAMRSGRPRAIQMVFQNPIRRSTLPGHARDPHARRAEARGARGGSVRARSIRSPRREGRAALPLQEPAELSGGQKQRIAIARRLCRRPDARRLRRAGVGVRRLVQPSILNLLVELQAKERFLRLHQSRPAIVRYISDRIGVMFLADTSRRRRRRTCSARRTTPTPRRCSLRSPSSTSTIPASASLCVAPMPSLSEPPSGCRFHTRCHRVLGDVCVQRGATRCRRPAGGTSTSATSPRRSCARRRPKTMASGEGAKRVADMQAPSGRGDGGRRGRPQRRAKRRLKVRCRERPPLRVPS